MNKILKLLPIALFTISTFSYASETIELWHSFAGSLGQQLQTLADQFNQSTPDYHLKLVYKGDYTESLTSFAASYHAGHPPDMVQIFEVGKDTILTVKEIIEPVGHLLSKESQQHLLPAVRSYYSQNQTLMAYPLNVSVPVMFYNRNLVENALAGKPFPKTWQALEDLLIKLKKQRGHCGYTTAYPAWIHLESFASLHGLSLTDDSSIEKVDYQQEGIHRHLSRLKDWRKKRLFHYGGRDSDATHLFTSQECAVFSQSSGSWRSLQAIAHFPVGVAPLPMDTKLSQTRYANAFGGAALWVTKTQKRQKLAGIKAWINFLAKPEIQWQWYQHTGYLPMIDDISKFQSSPILKIAKEDLIDSKPGKQVTWGPQNQLRIILDQAIESIFSQSESVNFALLGAEEQANFRLKRFKRNYLKHA